MCAFIADSSTSLSFESKRSSGVIITAAIDYDNHGSGKPEYTYLVLLEYVAWLL